MSGCARGCDGALVAVGGWRVCRECGGATTASGKYLPPHSGWDMPRVPRSVVCWQNGTVMVFDCFGQQIGRLQCLLTDRDRVAGLAAELAADRWKYRCWGQGMPRQASEAWLSGRAAEIAAWQRVAPDFARQMAEQEDRMGRTIFEPREL